MNVLLSLFFSLVLTSFVSFAIPSVFCVLILGGLNFLSHFDLTSIWSNLIYESTWNFFAVFGEGSVWNGILTIGIVSAIAGLIFESLNFYRYQILIDQNPYSSWQSEKIGELFSKIIFRSKS